MNRARFSHRRRIRSHRRGRTPSLLALLMLILGPFAPRLGGQEPLEDRFQNTRLLFCFQGKGSCLPYDAGVLVEAYQRIPALRQQQSIVAGNSSGSILAAYFGCYGFTDTSVRYAEYKLLAGGKDAVRNMENPHSKAAKMLRGKPTEIPHLELKEYIAFALGVQDWQHATSIDDLVRRSRVIPRYPTLIVACNREVLEDRDPDDSLVSRGYKEIDPETLTVSWRPEVYEYYRQHPQQFAQDHPDLKLGPDRRIGKAVTFFVDDSLYRLLQRLPADERTADLRRMDTPADVALAIVASTSEPTYFDAIGEPHPEKLRLAYPGRIQKRTYYGGYLLPLPAQDVRRVLPGIHVLGTGWRHNPLAARRLLEAWLLADVELIAQHCEWWADVEVNPDAVFQSHMVFRDLTSQQEFDFGRRRAQACFAGEAGRPRFVIAPRLSAAAETAIWPRESLEESQLPRESTNGKRELRTLRGLQPLLASPSARSANFTSRAAEPVDASRSRP